MPRGKKLKFKRCVQPSSPIRLTCAWQVEAEASPDTAHTETVEPPTKRLTAISGFQAPLPVRANARASKVSQGKMVQEMIRDNVGKRPPAALSADLGTSTSTSTNPSAASPANSQNGFLKPSGVDAPAASRASKTKQQSASTGAPLPKKRDREDAGDAGAKKRRKKKGEKGPDVRMID